MAPEHSTARLEIDFLLGCCYPCGMDGEMKLDDYVIDVLMPDLVGHDRHPSAFLVYLYLWRRTAGGERSSGELSLATLAENIGLSKRAGTGQGNRSSVSSSRSFWTG